MTASPMSTMLGSLLPRRAATLAAALALTATALVAGPWVGSASAAAVSFDVANEAEYRAALSALNDTDTFTINIIADFAMNGDTTPGFGDDLDLTINGNGHTVSYGTDEGKQTAFFAFGGDVLSDIDLTVNDLTLNGFDYDGAIYVYTNLAVVEINNSHFNNNGYFADSTDGGGALLVRVVDTEGSSLVVSDSTFTNNGSGASGGAVESDAYVDVYDSTFTNNFTTKHGGAIAAWNGIFVEDSTFTNNVAGFENSDTDMSEDTYDGGAINVDGDAEIEGSTFTGNSAPLGSGGAVWADDTIWAWQSSFNGNSAYAGGGLYSDSDDVWLLESAFSGNTAVGEAGAVYAEYMMYVESSTFDGNSAGDGGALYSYDEDVFVYNSTFYDNLAEEDGGAIWGYNLVYVEYSTFSSNEASDEGAHIYSDEEDVTSYATVYVNALGDAHGCDAIDVFSDGGNFDDEGTCTDGWNDVSDIGDGPEVANLGALADNGGPTKTMKPGDGSDLIDAIEDVEGYCFLEDYIYDQEGEEWNDYDNDQRGVERMQGDGCDIGAVEVIEDLTIEIVTDGGTVTGTVEGATCIDDETFTAAGDASTAPPAGLSLPFGLLGYNFCVPSSGWTVTVTLETPSPVTSLWKLTDTTWSEVNTADISGTTITYQLTDGGALDEDGDANAYIVDPVGPALGAAFTG